MDWRFLYNPLAALGKNRGFIASIVVVIALGVLSWWGWIHLDGALDLHLGSQPTPLMAAVESLGAWLSLGLFLLVASKMFGGDGGLRAHLAAAGLGRIPYIFSCLIGAHQFTMGMAVRSIAKVVGGTITVDMNQPPTPLATTGIVLLLLMTVWSILLLYTGFKKASGVKESMAAWAFVVGILLAETVSLAAMYLIGRIGMG